jgi:hypothetical protein
VIVTPSGIRITALLPFPCKLSIFFPNLHFLTRLFAPRQLYKTFSTINPATYLQFFFVLMLGRLRTLFFHTQSINSAAFRSEMSTGAFPDNIIGGCY